MERVITRFLIISRKKYSKKKKKRTERKLEQQILKLHFRETDGI